MKAGVGQHNHLSVVLGEQGQEGLVVDIGSGAIPIGNQAPLVLYDAEFAPHDPAMVGLAFLGDLVSPAPFAYGMTQFYCVAVGHPQDGGPGQEVAGPVPLHPQPTVETSAAGQFGKRWP